ncbi:MAG: lysophospholipase [Pelagimonas sp.]|jgi:alpha-beta hydrolase superfamily lysophospholipase|nr:lysophospholipase [Pelagimonas sp.]
MATFLLICAVLAALWLLAPKEPVKTDVTFDSRALENGIEAYLQAEEAGVDDIREGAQKQVIWAGAPEAKTNIALVYIHGFSATLQETRPLSDQVARALGANLFLTRMAGHGRGSAAMAEPRVSDWMADLAEAIAIARQIGDKVVLIGNSTGSSLIALALREEMGQGVDATVLIAPNFRIKSKAAALLSWPFARLWGPYVAGKTHQFEPRSADHEKYWTTSYPMQALIPMAAAARAARLLDHRALRTPALFLFSDLDEVVDQRETRKVQARWGGDSTLMPVTPGPADDPAHHVIAGDVLSPGMTDPLAKEITNWIKERGL